MIILRFLLNLLLFLIPVIPFAALSAFVARRSREEWQLLAWVPAVPLAFKCLTLAIAVTRDPTSHNLWPFELLGWVALSIVLFVAMMVARWFARRQS